MESKSWQPNKCNVVNKWFSIYRSKENLTFNPMYTHYICTWQCTKVDSKTCRARQIISTLKADTWHNTWYAFVASYEDDGNSQPSQTAQRPGHSTMETEEEMSVCADSPGWSGLWLVTCHWCWPLIGQGRGDPNQSMHRVRDFMKGRRTKNPFLMK